MELRIQGGRKQETDTAKLIEAKRVESVRGKRHIHLRCFRETDRLQPK